MLRLGAPGFVGVDHVEDGLFALADDHSVEEGAHRFRVIAARAAGDDQRVGDAAVGGAQGDASQVEHGEHVGVELLVRQAEADDVEGGQRMARLQAVEGNVLAAHSGLEVGPGAVDALGEQVGPFVDQVVEDHEAQVAAAEFVDIGESKRDLGADGWAGPVFGDTVEFAAGVAGGLLDSMQHAVEAACDLFGVGKHRYPRFFSSIEPVSRPERG